MPRIRCTVHRPSALHQAHCIAFLSFVRIG
jgi:hypothetical protein